jgi:hypothetical protein
MSRSPWGHQKPPPWAPIDPAYARRMALAGSWIMADGGGPTLRDSGLNRLHGSITAGLWTPGRAGPALAFDGVSSVVTITDSPAFAFGTGDFAISLRVLMRDVLRCQEIVSKALGSGTYAGWIVRCADATNTSFGPFTFLPYNSGGTQVNGTVTPTINTWYHLVAQRSAGTIALWVNGVLEATQANASDVTCPAELWIGGDIGTWAGFYGDMLLDFVQIFGRSLTPGEIRMLGDNPYVGWDVSPGRRFSGRPAGLTYVPKGISRMITGSPFGGTVHG